MELEFLLNSHYSWLLNIIAIVCITALLHSIEKRFFRNLSNKSLIESSPYLNTVIYGLSIPIAFTIWFAGFAAIALLLREKYFENLTLFWLDDVLRVGVILVIAWVLKRIIDQSENNAVKQIGNKKVDKTTAMAISRLLYIVLFIVTVLVIMQSLHINVSGIITLGSAGTLVIGIAAKDMLANFFGALMIFTDKPFKIGDWVKSPDKQIEGHVEHIGWRATRIRTFEKRPLYVPNAVFLTIAIENPSRMSNRRIKDVLGLRYKDISKVPVITQQVEDMLQSHPEIDTKQPCFVRLSHFGDSTLDCQIYCFTKTTNRMEYLKAQQDVLLKIAEIVKQNDADMAYPTMTIEMQNESVS